MSLAVSTTKTNDGRKIAAVAIAAPLQPAST
jgi:hypothetical protein